MTKHTSAHASKSKKHGKVKGVHISLMNNGAKAQLMHAAPDDSMYGGEVPGEESVHTSMPSLMKHIKSNIGDHFASNTGAGGATQPAAKPAGGGAAEAEEENED